MNPGAECIEGIRLAAGAVRANLLRSILTTLGIIIGVLTVTLMGTALEGLNLAFEASMSFIGSDVLYVERQPWIHLSERDWRRIWQRPTITYSQARALAEKLELARAVAPMTPIYLRVSHEGQGSQSVVVVGTTEAFAVTRSLILEEGRFFTDAEADGGRPVCVLGWGVATNLFPNQSAVGQDIRIAGNNFAVVGVIQKQGSMLQMFSPDVFVAVPLRQFIANFWSHPDFQIQIKASDPSLIDDLRDLVTGWFRKIRRLAPGQEEDFAINQQQAVLTAFQRVRATIAAVGLFITSLSLFVGGIGIMNIMFVSVAERTGEIGLRKAVGARRRTILTQFLIEAAMVCLCGGALALLLAWPLTLLMARWFPAVLSLKVASLALAVSATTGIVSGFLPAWRAARLDPVEALRHE